MSALKLRACIKMKKGPAAADFGPAGRDGELRASPKRAVSNEPTLATGKRRAARRVFAQKGERLGGTSPRLQLFTKVTTMFNRLLPMIAMISTILNFFCFSPQPVAAIPGGRQKGPSEFRNLRCVRAKFFQTFLRKLCQNICNQLVQNVAEVFIFSFFGHGCCCGRKKE